MYFLVGVKKKGKEREANYIAIRLAKYWVENEGKDRDYFILIS